MDAVRAQNMSCYGYEKKTTPMLDKNILSHSMLYKNAISSSCWTLPSHASTFTGTYSSKHGLVVDGDILDPNYVTIAEFLKSQGYFTAGLCKFAYVSSFSGLNRGFDRFYDYRFFEMRGSLYKLMKKLKEHKQHKNKIYKNFKETTIYKRLFYFLTRNFDSGAKFINTLSVKLIQKIKQNQFFLFIHYPEAHLPYIIPKFYKEKYLTTEMNKKKPWLINQDYLRYYLEDEKMDEIDFDILRAFYNGSINYLDKKIYEIYSLLKKEKLLSDTMIIITSDHGDNLGEHNMMFHWWCLYDTLIKIPLIIKYPENFKLVGEENKVVQNVDLLPTIMDILNVKEDKLNNQIQGNSLFSQNIKNRSYFYSISELMQPFRPSMRYLKIKLKKYDRRLICIRSKDKKYILASDGKDEFYDLRTDPYECKNIITSGDSSIYELKEKLKPWLKNFLARAHDIDGVKKFEFDTKIIERLRKLGYIS